MPEIIVKLGESLVHRYTFDKDVVSVGRARDNDIVLETLSVSRNHARIRREADRYVLTDLQSANGTFVNGVKINRTELKDEDVVTVGKHQLHFLVQKVSDEQAISDAFGADRTVMVNVEPVAVLTVSKGKQKDQEFTLDRYETLIGRSNDCHVQLHDWFVGKKHAVIFREKGAFTIKDLGKLAGVAVNDQPVREPRQLHEGDVIRISNVTLSFRLGGPQQPALLTGRKPVEIGLQDEMEFDSRVDEEFDDMQAMSSKLADDDEFEDEDEDVLSPVASSMKTEVAMGIDPEAQEPEDDLFALGAAEAPMAGAGSAKTDETVDSILPEDIAHSDMEDLEDASPNIGEVAGEASIDEPPAVAESGAAEAALAEDVFLPPSGELELVDVLPGDFDSPAPVVGAVDPQPPEMEDEDALVEAPFPVEPAAEAEEIIEEISPPEQAEEAPAPASPEIALWERALKNPSPVIRAEAARMLKRLTGKEYDA